MAEEEKDIPQELLLDIALRLPAKSIARFKSVSKPCNFFFSTSEFVKSHLHYHARRAPDRIVLLDRRDRAPHAVTLPTEGEGGGRSREVRSIRLNGTVSELLGCCNGLILLKVERDFFKFSLVVINPVTSRSMRFPVPFSSSTGRDLWKEWKIGLGYCSVEDDYKIIALWDTVSVLLRNVSVFSLRTRRWMKLASSSYMPCSNRSRVYVDGCLHWLAYRGNLVIVAFDLSTEKYEEVPFPTGFQYDELKHPGYELADMGGCLALLDRNLNVFGNSYVNTPIDVWIMERAGEKLCWRKFTIANYPPNPEKDKICCNYEVICRLGESEFVLSKSQKELVAYNCETGVWRDMVIDGLPKVFAPQRILTYRESLACPGLEFF